VTDQLSLIFRARHLCYTSAHILSQLITDSAGIRDLLVLTRGVAMYEATDLVLLNVAVHVNDAMNEPSKVRTTRRAAAPSRRRNRRRFRPFITPASPVRVIIYHLCAIDTFAPGCDQYANRLNLQSNTRAAPALPGLVFTL
jgi:hypothetical protein